jgi:hypothetical protein
VVTRGAVGDLLTGAQQCAHVAQVRVACTATWATAARGDEPENHMVARCKPTHAWADSFNNAGAFMAANDGHCKGKITRDHVLVAVAHSRGSDFDKNFSGLWGIELNFLYGPRCIQLPQNCGFGLHDFPL